MGGSEICLSPINVFIKFAVGKHALVQRLDVDDERIWEIDRIGAKNNRKTNCIEIGKIVCFRMEWERKQNGEVISH